MGTLRNVWNRLKALLDSAVRGKPPAAKADPQLTAAVQQFTTNFLRAFAQIEKQYKDKAAIEADLKKSTAEALKLVQTLKQKVAVVGDSDLDGRVDEMADRLKELNRDGFQVQWD